MHRGVGANAEVFEIAKGRLGGTVSLVRSAENLVAVYSDWETTSLYAVEVPISDRLPLITPNAKMIDKIDTAPPFSSFFGEHAVAARGGAVTVLYLTRGAEDKLILKIASRGPGAQSWTVDAIEPPGYPLAVLPAEGDQLDLFWAAGPLLHLRYPANGQADSLFAPFSPAEQDGKFAETWGEGISSNPGMTVYDSISRALLVFRWNGHAYDQQKIDGAGPIHSSVLFADGRLDVLSWNPTTRRLELFVQNQNQGAYSRALVTMCEGTSAVALLPAAAASVSAPGPGATGARDDRFLFLYNDTRRLGGGRSLYALSLLAPRSGWGAAKLKYRRMILLSDTKPIIDFSALEVAETLYVLVHQDGLKLLRLRLPE
jgi:hypothetical protein